jgi:EpsI family protein
LRGPASQRLAAVFALWIAVAVIYWPASRALNGIWLGPGEFSHGYLILLISLWLIVRHRERLAAQPIRPATGALALTAVLSIAWLSFWRAAIQDLHLLLLPLILLAGLAAGLGWRSARELLFPIGYLYFAMPAWEQLTGVLQVLSAKATGVLIWLTGIPAVMQGDLIHLPAGTLRIEGGCAGINTLLVGLALAALYGEVCRDPPRQRLIWVGLMAIICLVTNWLRIFVVTVVAYQSDMRSPLVAHHKWLGWWLFVLAVTGFVTLAGRLRRPQDPGMSGKPPEEAARPPRSPGWSLAHAAATLACLGILPALAYGTDASALNSHAAPVIRWPGAPAGWSGPQPAPAGDWAPLFARADAQGLRRYLDGHRQPIDVFAVAYRTQTQQAKLLGYGNTLLGSESRSVPRAERIVEVPTGAWREILVIDPDGRRALIWSRYRIGDRIFVHARLAQLWYGVAGLAFRPVSSLMALRAFCVPDCAVAHERLSAAAELEPVVLP